MSTIQTPHTPTPWSILPKRLLAEYGGLRFLEPIATIAHYTDEGPDMRWEVIAENLSNADAAFLVQAVNSHAALVEALETALLEIPDGMLMTNHSAGIQQIRKALALARKETRP